MSWSRLFGLDGGPFYNFFSGLFGVLVITGGLVVNAWVNARRHNCHQPRCWRVGRLPVQGTAYVVCRRHHPNPPKEETIQERYHLYAGRRPGRG
jgi:hypothetical protein